MARSSRRRVAVRRALFETIEHRLVFSGQPLGDFALEQLEPPPLVHFAQPIPTLSDVHSTTGVNYVRSTYGLDGWGQTVAVIDSGIAYDHYALGGGYGNGRRVVGGWDFAENDANPYDDAPGGFHGTHVAGIIGSTNNTYRGVAPGVNFVSLRVFADDGAGYFNWVESALQWVHQHRNDYAFPITTVNMSLGTEWNATSVPNWSTIEDELQQLRSDGIFVAVAAGNSFASYNVPGLSYPASSPHVVPIMSVMNSGIFSTFSQRHSRAIGAPGQSITSTVPDYTFGSDGVPNDFGTASGTSMAAPYAAGAAMLVREAMQLVGYTSITQDTIYQHLRSTADTFFDTATNANYLRINVQRAIDALMPADDYGSTAATASNLGQLGGERSLSGLIGRLDDADYFTFTANATGTLNLSVAETNRLDARLQQVGGSSSDTGQLSFNVVAGQSYTFAVSTTSGLGRFTIDMELESAIVDWGAVEQRSILNQSIAGQENWFQVQATRSGLLTIEAFFNGQLGDVHLELYSAGHQLLCSGIDLSGGGGERTDFEAVANQTYFLRVTGANSDTDFRLTNLVRIVGNEVTATGTTGADTFTFTAGANFQLDVNGVQYLFAAGSANRFVLQGGGGQDRLNLNGSSRAETFSLRVGLSELTASDYSVSAASFEDVRAGSGGGADTALLYDSTGDDLFYGFSTHCWMQGSGFFHGTNGFARVTAYANNGGNDLARLYDSAGNDSFFGFASHAWMQGTGFFNGVNNFDRVNVYASAGGDDIARLYDSVGNDLFTGNGTQTSFTGSGFYYHVERFERVNVYATSGGNDTANLNGTDGNDVFHGYANQSWMSGTSFYNFVQGFDRVNARAGTGNDIAYLFDSASNDQFYGFPTHGWFTGAGFFNGVDGFDRVNVYAASGGNDIARLYDSAGDDLFYGFPSHGWITGNGFFVGINQFDRVNVYAKSGGYDLARLYDSAGNDIFDGRAAYSSLFGSGYYNYVESFERVNAYANAGGLDRAALYDDIGDDVFVGTRAYSYLSGRNFLNHASGFERVEAHAGSGGYDRSYLTGSTDAETLYCQGSLATLQTSGVELLIDAFDELAADLAGGGDIVQLSAIDFLFSRYGTM